MTLSTLSSKNEDTANGVAVDFTFSFKANDEDHVKVYVNGEVKATDDATYGHSISGIGSDSGTVSFLSAPPDGDIISILRVVPAKQEVEYPSYSPFPSAAHEGALDLLTMLIQQIEEIQGRTVKTAIGSNLSTDLTLPEYSAGKAIIWDESSEQLAVSVNGVDNVVELANDALVLADAARDAAEAAAATAAADVQANIDTQVFGTQNTWTKNQIANRTTFSGQSSVLIDFSHPEILLIVDQNVDISFTNVYAGTEVRVMVYNGSSTVRTLNWPSSVHYPSGTNLNSGANGEYKMFELYAYASMNIMLRATNFDSEIP